MLDIAPLTTAQKIAIYDIIHANAQEDDRAPREVIDDPRGPYFGNEEAYLRAMAKWHSIDLGAIPDTAHAA